METLFPQPFPWRLFFRFVVIQLAIAIPILLIARVPWGDILCFALIFLGASVWLGRKFFLPFARMMARMKTAKSSGPLEVAPVMTDGEIADGAIGEWEDLEGELSRMRTDLQDRSDALQREREEIDILMEAIPDAILAIDDRAQILFYNSRFAMIFGDWKTRGQPAHLGDIFRAPGVLETYRASLQEAAPKACNIRLHVGPDQASRDFALSVTPLRREGARGYGAVGIFHDVSELKQAERIRIDFVANVSHELRTPLTAIKGYTETLSQDLAQGRQELVGRYLEIINRNVERLMFLIEDLLDLSSLESGVELLRSPVSTKDVTTRVLTQIEQKRVAKKQIIEAAFDADVVQGDQRRVEQVLVNLVDNAVKYVPIGARIQVKWERQRDMTVLRVSDNGPGIDAEDQQRLFERFYRVDKARSREMGGTGLGLAIVKHIMQRHGGSVRVRSTPGQGTEFICDFPDGVL